MPPEENNRTFRRRRTLFGGTIFKGSQKWDCRISDISESGVRVRTDCDLEIGTLVELKITKINDFREAEIVWKTENFIGLNFLVRIDPKNAEVALLFRPINS